MPGVVCSWTLGCATLSLLALALLPHKEVFLRSCALSCFAFAVLGVTCPQAEAGQAAAGSLGKAAAREAAKAVVGEAGGEAKTGFCRTVKAWLAAGAAFVGEARASIASSLMLVTLSV